MKLIPVDPTQIERFREGRRGRVSYPILKMFLESNEVCVKVDRAGMQQSLQSLHMTLNGYVRTHGLPVKPFQNNGELYLLRTDTDEKTGTLPSEPVLIDGGRRRDAITVHTNGTEAPIDDVEVERRFAEEKGQFTK